MKLGRVVGRVVATRKMAELEGLKLLLVQPIDEKGADAGAPLGLALSLRAGAAS